ncbi:hypothetical protein BZG36_05272 [Bifiguratus adelaidae]|uniref:CLASP N-terminal domain-containing protein n=1 Tax=Bifiguratus adelaidae TaxID=1938954 RepID=A0A261XU42_9FUNG|nr:hypothetical protein BZG36_05272 [Bifiguratus adelaidae]
MATVVYKVTKLPSQSDFDRELRRLETLFAQKESELTWDSFENALKSLTDWVKHGVVKYPGFPSALKTLRTPIVDSMLTERTRLSGAAIELTQTLSSHMLSDFEPWAEYFVPPVLELCKRTNKLFVLRGTACLKVMVKEAKSSTAITQSCAIFLTKPTQSKTLKTAALDAIAVGFGTLKASELEIHREKFEAVIQKAAIDAAPEVRTLARTIYNSYKTTFPQHHAKYIDTLPTDVRKNLKINGVARKSMTVRKINPAFLQAVRKAEVTNTHSTPLSVKRDSTHPVHNATNLKRPASHQLSRPELSKVHRVESFPGVRNISTSTQTKRPVLKAHNSLPVSDKEKDMAKLSKPRSLFTPPVLSKENTNELNASERKERLKPRPIVPIRRLGKPSRNIIRPPPTDQPKPNSEPLKSDCACGRPSPAIVR